MTFEARDNAAKVVPSTGCSQMEERKSARKMKVTAPPTPTLNLNFSQAENVGCVAQLGCNIQRFRVRHRLSCVIGLVWPVGAGCYSQAALPMPLSNPLYGTK